jgi:hypothetical protein
MINLGDIPSKLLGPYLWDKELIDNLKQKLAIYRYFSLSGKIICSEEETNFVRFCLLNSALYRRYRPLIDSSKEEITKQDIWAQHLIEAFGGEKVPIFSLLSDEPTFDAECFFYSFLEGHAPSTRYVRTTMDKRQRTILTDCTNEFFIVYKLRIDSELNARLPAENVRQRLHGLNVYLCGLLEEFDEPYFVTELREAELKNTAVTLLCQQWAERQNSLTPTFGLNENFDTSVVPTKNDNTICCPYPIYAMRPQEARLNDDLQEKSTVITIDLGPNDKVYIPFATVCLLLKSMQ